MSRLPLTRSPLHTALWVDATFELLAGAVLLLMHGSVSSWLDVSETGVVATGLVFVAAAIGIAAIAMRSSLPRSVASALATLNLAGGIAIWCVLPFAWPDVRTEGRWLALAIADSLLGIAALEFLALSRGGNVADPTE